jgi:hypothetical protein
MANRKWAVNYALNMEPTSVVVRKREIEMKQRDGIGKIVRRRPGGRSQGLGAHKQLHRPTIRKLQVSQYTHVCAARSALLAAPPSSSKVPGNSLALLMSHLKCRLQITPPNIKHESKQPGRRPKSTRPHPVLRLTLGAIY